MSDRLIDAPHSIIFSPDGRHEEFEPVVRTLGNIEGLSGVKLGIRVAFGGLDRMVGLVREHMPDGVAIFDMQKAGNDIPDMGLGFADDMGRFGVDAAILFPFAGPVTQQEWTKALKDNNVRPIVGAEMTGKGFTEPEGGYVSADSYLRIFETAIEDEVRDFVVPGNKPDRIAFYKKYFDSTVGENEYVLYSPGLITQGGDMSESGRAAGGLWHAIVGSAIYRSDNPRGSAVHLAKQVLELNCGGA